MHFSLAASAATRSRNLLTFAAYDETRRPIREVLCHPEDGQQIEPGAAGAKGQVEAEHVVGENGDGLPGEDPDPAGVRLAHLALDGEGVRTSGQWRKGSPCQACQREGYLPILLVRR